MTDCIDNDVCSKNNEQGFDESWEKVHKSMEWGRYPPEELVRYIMKNFKSLEHSRRSDLKILEIGCGQGANTWFLQREGFTTFGIDGSFTALQKAKAWLSEEDLYPKFSIMDACDLGFTSNEFDVVIDVACIYSHIKNDIKNIFNDIVRVLKPEGRFFSTGLFNTETTGFGTGDQLEERTYKNVRNGVGEGGRGKVHYFTREEISSLMENYFREVRVDRITRTEHSGEKQVSYFVVDGVKR